ncbi:glycinin G4-like [Prosopis cineraria]|uniref:glycinin G4-like n=1 Tax=Prosopis cineraria TaxID=364024 RepID=UPI00240FE376|nr:glycinin G4-like [Prosopis cineraria]
MPKPNTYLLGFSTLLVVLGVCLARRAEQKQFNECQLERLNALEPDHRVQSEAGVTESWNANHPELRCAGVAVVRRTLYTNALHLPSYSNGAQMHFIVQGRGVIGVAIPGCAETYDAPQPEDRHQKLHEIKEGDIVAIPVGISYWTYNNGDTPLVAITLIDTTNEENQLDPNPRRFYLAGNPKEEHPETLQGKHGKQQQQRKNMLSGFETRSVEDAFNVDEEIASNLQSQSARIDQMITVRGGLGIMSRPQSQQGQQEEREEKQRQQGEGSGNSLEETLCGLKIHQNIADPSQADFFNPLAGRISGTSLFDLPILRRLQLSAQHVVLYRRGMYTPHWNVNANSIIYVTRGRGGVQVVNWEGRLVFDGELRRGQLLVVPQNFAVAHQAWDEGFDFICFRTHELAIITPILGKQSFFEATPAKVLANVYGLRLQQALDIKHSREEGFLFSPSQSQEPLVVKA